MYNIPILYNSWHQIIASKQRFGLCQKFSSIQRLNIFLYGAGFLQCHIHQRIYIYINVYIYTYVHEKCFKSWYIAFSSLIADMFRPSGTLQYNPKFPKISLKLNEFESVIYNLVYRIQQFQYILKSYNNHACRVIN